MYTYLRFLCSPKGYLYNKVYNVHQSQLNQVYADYAALF